MPSKPTKCPQCSNDSLWRNEGVSKKNNKPYANLKCNKCGYIEWLSVSDKTQDSPQTTSGFQKPFQRAIKAPQNDINKENEIILALQDIKQGINLILDILQREMGEN